ncbi:YqcI/YcgG family protein [Streptomyces sp. NPDC087903]|uniref:YqcI/YcgG family protein n=1 Tax=Streptomyces sp. NPDC087903 TaxID=3365819 RepID=UPI0037F52F86
MSFEEIAERTYCPFARTSKLGPPVTVTGLEFEKELHRHRDTIAEFFSTARDNSYDGMVITFEDPSAGATLDALVDLTRRFYSTLAELYPSVYLQDDPDPDETWYAMIGGEQFFVVSFAPCYPADSPRHTYGDRRTHVLLQPASTFERNAAAIDRRRERIHRAFTAVGKPYDARLANVQNDMFKSVMPIDPIDQHIPWWDESWKDRRQDHGRAQDVKDAADAPSPAA